MIQTIFPFQESAIVDITETLFTFLHAVVTRTILQPELLLPLYILVEPLH
jgi:hypothetical protein